MKLLTAFSLGAACTTAFVLPDEDVFAQITPQSRHLDAQKNQATVAAASPYNDKLEGAAADSYAQIDDQSITDLPVSGDDLLNLFQKGRDSASDWYSNHAVPAAENVVDEASSRWEQVYESSVQAAQGFKDDASDSLRHTALDLGDWVDVQADRLTEFDGMYEVIPDSFNKIGEVYSDISADVKADLVDLSDSLGAQSDSITIGHGHHRHEPNETIYQLLSSCKYTTKLTEWINEYPDLVELFNTTSSTNYTLFAPIDSAFDKIPHHKPAPSKDELKQILMYHTSKEFYPAGRVLVTHTVPSMLVADHIGGEAQRLSTNIGLKGLTVDFYSRIVAVDIFATNGVIHGIDTILRLPPQVVDVIQMLPGEFSTLALALEHTGLAEHMYDTSLHVGGTVFAPSNFAFQKLGTKVNAYLFSKHGRHHLKALLLYHLVPNQTLYSDAYYGAKSDALNVEGANANDKTTTGDTFSAADIPKGYYHYDLKTALDNKVLGVDIARYGRYINMKVNAFAGVSIEDAVADDGVIQVVSSVLIPPHVRSDGSISHHDGEEISVADLVARLDSTTKTERTAQPVSEL